MAKIKFVKRGGAVAAIIPESDLSAHEFSSMVPDPIEMTRVQELELPKEVDVVYIDQSSDYQQNTQRSSRMTGSSVNVVTISLPIVLVDSKSKEVADVNLFNLWSSRTKYKFALSRKWSKLEPTDVVDITKGTITHRIRITKKDSSRPGILTLEGEFEDSSIYTQSGTGAAPSGVATQTIATPTLTYLEFLDVPALRDSDDEAGFYVAMAGYIAASWKGAKLFKSSDAGATYTDSVTSSAPTIMGRALGALADFSGGNIFDESSSVTVSLLDGGTLSSISELLVLNGGNAALLGSEIVQFKNATLVSTGVYTLTGLLRGCKGTEWAMSSHAINDIFVFLTVDSLRRASASTAEIGLSRTYKAVTFGQSIQQTAEKTFTNTAEALECRAVVQVGAGADASGNITINWIRQNRINAGWKDSADVPMSENVESYEIEIWDAGFANLKRTLTSSSQTVAYSAANQTTDFGSTQSTLRLKIYQLSAINGRGHVKQSTVVM